METRLKLVLCLVASVATKMNKTHTQQYHCFTDNVFNCNWFISLVTRAEHDSGMETRLKLVSVTYVCSFALNVNQNLRNTY